MDDHILTLNAGSSSIKFALFAAEQPLRRVAAGEIDGLGATPRFRVLLGDAAAQAIATQAQDHQGALAAIMRWLETAFAQSAVAAVGHRIVHGGAERSAPLVLDGDALEALRALIPLAPLHQPHNIAGVEAARKAFPHAPQIGCFDTAFHRGHRFVNEVYALPRAFYDRGVRRYGFHGLSYESILRYLRAHEPALACARVIVAHLGAGASLCAMQDGRSVATTMGFSPLDGAPMATRCGAIDPGVLLYLLDQEKMTPAALGALLYRESGLKGLCGLSDMRAIEAAQTPEARDAFDYFAHRVRIEIAGLAAALQGVDAIVFTAGVGEHSPRLRAAVIRGLAWLGFALDDDANARSAARISPREAPPVLVAPTEEEMTIALHTVAAAGLRL